MDKILIDAQTKQMIIDLFRMRDEIQLRLQLILQVYLNAKGVNGAYNLSPDYSELVKAEEERKTEG